MQTYHSDVRKLFGALLALGTVAVSINQALSRGQMEGLTFKVEGLIKMQEATFILVKDVKEQAATKAEVAAIKIEVAAMKADQAAMKETVDVIAKTVDAIAKK